MIRLTGKRIAVAVGLALVLLVSTPWTRTAIAQSLIRVVSGLTVQYMVPAYLKSCNYSATTTGNVCHTGPTAVGCVVMNTAGAAGSTIKLYDQAGLVANSAYLLDTIDATSLIPRCYGSLFKGGVVVVVASGGAAPDFKLTYQGQ